MTSTKLKQTAQDYLMHALNSAFYAINDDSTLTEIEKVTMSAEASKQMERIEKLFGYIPKSWGRGN